MTTIIFQLRLEIDDNHRRKIAYDMGRYADDLPDGEEIQDWIEQLINDKLDELPEASNPEGKR